MNYSRRCCIITEMHTTLLTLKFCKIAKFLQQNEVEKLLTNVESRGHERKA